MKKIREQISLVLLLGLYVLCSLRYYPGDWSHTFVETLIHMLSVAPFGVGVTILLVTILRKLAGAQLPWDRVLRIFLIVVLVIELLYGISYYLKVA